MRNDYLILVSKLMDGLAWLTRHAGLDWSMWLMTNTLSPYQHMYLLKSQGRERVSVRCEGYSLAQVKDETHVLKARTMIPVCLKSGVSSATHLLDEAWASRCVIYSGVCGSKVR